MATTVQPEPISFVVEGTTVRGRLYIPRTADGRKPAVVILAHGWSMVAGGNLEDYAQVFVARGLAVLTFDFRRLGQSDGLPRQEIDPVWQIEDYRCAISYVRSRPETDGERIGVWGTSYSGGHALVVAALDRRVKCVVSQVPTVDGHAAALRRVRYDQAEQLQRFFEQDREDRFNGKPPRTKISVSDQPGADVAYPGHDSYDYMMSEARRCPTWANEVTLRSLELARAYLPGAYVRRIAPTPLLMIVAARDGLTPADLQQDTFACAHEPKKLMLVDGGHYSVYTSHFDETSRAAADWFGLHLVS